MPNVSRERKLEINIKRSRFNASTQAGFNLCGMTLTFLFIYFGLAIRSIMEAMAVEIVVCGHEKYSPNIYLRVKAISFSGCDLAAVDLATNI